MVIARIKRLVIVASVLVLAGCASTEGPQNPADPWEGMNRGTYAFNDAVDKAVFKPIAELYAFITPRPVRTCIRNMYLNLGEIWSMINSNLQQRHVDAINTTGRFLFNTTMGLGGCIDVASMNGQPRIENDFGITLGVWGVPQGPYLVLPFLGASTVRDGVGTGVDFVGNQLDTIGQIPNVRLRNSLWGLEVVVRREALLTVSETVDRTALDPYSFIRDAYLQRRAAMVAGDPDAQDLPDYEDYADVEADEKALGISQEKD
ncbi:MAG: VacJ family lipoprotein [Burkholderiaceae bacterium]|nr:VacJ family lipoprotein [Burkholderiaceae bacterium]